MPREIIELKKTLVILLDIVMIVVTVVPAVLLLASCIHDAIFGVIPTGFQYGLYYEEKIYGLEAFINTFLYYCTVMFVGVVLWVGMFISTLAFTVFTVVFVKSEPVSLDGI